MKKLTVLDSLVIFSLVFFLFTPNISQAKTYYVDLNHPSASDTNPGTLDLPWLTIQHAAETMVAGDTVYIKAGTYQERVVPQNSGSGDNYIVYAAYLGDTVTIDGEKISLSDCEDGLFVINEKSYIKVLGLRIINAGPNHNNAGILVYNSSHIIIEKNYTYNTVSSGIGVWNSDNIIIDGNQVELACNDGEQECITVAGTDIFEIKNNYVHRGGPGTRGGEGIDAKDGSSNGKIYKNCIHDMVRAGIYVDSWDKHTYNIDVFWNTAYDIRGGSGFALASEAGGLLENIKIYNNVAYNNEEVGFVIGAWGEPVPKHPIKNVKVINNTFYNNGKGSWGGGISIENPDAENIVIRNNICSQNLLFQIQVEVSIPNLTVDHNLIDGYRGYVNEIYGDDYVEGDPKFVNPSGADFHLQKDSPAIGSGSAIDAPSDDFDGNPRPQGDGYDIGAYEYINANGQALCGPEQAVPNKHIVGVCDAACQQGAPVKAGTQTLDVCMNYSGPVTALVGIMTQDFSATQWLRADNCSFSDNFQTAMNGSKYLNCSNVQVSEPFRQGWVFWLVSPVSLDQLDWQSGDYELLFFALTSNDATKMTLANVKYWAYNIQDVDTERQRKELVDTHFDMYVLEPVVTEKGKESFDMASLIQDIRDHNIQTRNTDPLIIAYIDMGQAETWRWYYDDSWGIGNPEWIVGEDPDLWEGCYPVAYWHDDWENIVIYGYGAEGRSMVEESLIQGFDGIYMDWVEGFSDVNVIAKATTDGVDPATAMFDFIEKIRNYARNQSPNANAEYLVIAQNASDLYQEDPARYRGLMDAIALEGIWYDGTGGFDDWDDNTGYNVRTNDLYEGYTEEVLGYLEPMKSHMPIFCVEYAQDMNGQECASEVYNTLAPAQGFIPYCSRRSLSRLSTTPYPVGYSPQDY